MPDNTKTKNTKPHPPLRWWWIGLSFAAILWLGSGIYHQRIQTFDEIEALSDNTTSDEINQRIALREKHHRWCQYAAIALAIGSLGHLGYKITHPKQPL